MSTDFARDAAHAGIGVAVAVAEVADQRRQDPTDEVTARLRELVAAAVRTTDREPATRRPRGAMRVPIHVDEPPARAQG